MNPCVALQEPGNHWPGLPGHPGRPTAFRSAQLEFSPGAADRFASIALEPALQRQDFFTTQVVDAFRINCYMGFGLLVHVQGASDL